VAELPSNLIRCGTVLVVDDDRLVLSSVKAMVEDMGHTVVEASSGCSNSKFRLRSYFRWFNSVFKWGG
jgi:DNA-binding NtrC family response regulator